MARHEKQAKLFDLPENLPNGLIYRPHFLSEDEEEILIIYLENLELKHAHLGEYTTKRKIKNFGWGYDFDNKKFIPGPPLPPFLSLLQRRIAKWIDIPARYIVEALVTEYTPGTAIGWHRDTEAFGLVIGISLGGWCRIRFRPLEDIKNQKKIINLDLEPRSAYIMQKKIRWDFQHSIPPTKTHRYSITFRTLPKELW